jgi:hypothetical protein
MYTKNTPPAARGQAQIDFLEHMLHNSKAPTLDKLLALAPDEPLGPPEGLLMVQKRGVGWTVGHRQRWPKSVLATTRAKFPGYQPGHWFRENMKYGRCPREGASLCQMVTVMLNHAKAKWSGEIDGRKTRLQFKEWLPRYLDNETLCWCGAPGLDAAREILRIACRLSRFSPTLRASR